MIWGESYAGVYVPTLALEVYNSKLPLKLQGFAVGNPCTDDATQVGLMGYVCAPGCVCVWCVCVYVSVSLELESKWS